ncbi:MAG TPA: helix-turn-helix domain-containing protein [Methanoregulaceae archaeon]|nr:helix-turn-helix domain-containing protein [Methanoregulaceae archaeon]
MQESCTVKLTVRYLAKKWTLLIVLELDRGPACSRRFLGTERYPRGIPQKVLSGRLRELEGEGLVTRRVDTSSHPVRTEYTLTGSGLGIVGVIRRIEAWALKWKVDTIACGSRDCRVCTL